MPGGFFGAVPADSAESQPASLAGGLASVQGLQSLPELEGSIVSLVSYDPGADRRRCELGGGGLLAIHPARLTAIPGRNVPAPRRPGGGADSPTRL